MEGQKAYGMQKAKEKHRHKPNSNELESGPGLGRPNTHLIAISSCTTTEAIRIDLTMTTTAHTRTYATISPYRACVCDYCTSELARLLQGTKITPDNTTKQKTSNEDVASKTKAAIISITAPFEVDGRS